MKNRRSEFASVVLPNGNVLAIGGRINDESDATSSCEIYNSSNDSWSWVVSMKEERRFHDVIMLRNGKCWLLKDLIIGIHIQSYMIQQVHAYLIKKN